MHLHFTVVELCLCTVYSLNLSSSGARADKIPDMARYTRDLDSVYTVSPYSTVLIVSSVEEG